MNLGAARKNDRRCRGANRGAAFTLLELVLALGLVAIVLGLLALSVDLHLRVAQLGRQQVEEAQLARVLLQRMAEDIRAAIPPQSADWEKLARTLDSLLEGVESLPLAELGLSDELSGSQSSENRSGSGAQGPGTSGGQSGGASGGSSSTSQGARDSASGETGETTEESATEETTETILGVPRSVPGIYGGPDWLQVDVSRMPRPEDYQLAGVAGSSGEVWELNRLSEAKTVLYGLMLPGSTMSMSQSLVSGQSWGLYRDEVDRASGVLASQQNLLDQKVRAAGPLAPEVVWLEFYYFDGSQWYDSWDSEAQGGLPVAIEVIIGLDMSRSPSVAGGKAASVLEEQVPAEPKVLYRTVVYLPVAKSASSQTTSTGNEEMTTTSGQEESVSE